MMKKFISNSRIFWKIRVTKKNKRAIINKIILLINKNNNKKHKNKIK